MSNNEATTPAENQCFADIQENTVYILEQTRALYEQIADSKDTSSLLDSVIAANPSEDPGEIRDGYKRFMENFVPQFLDEDIPGSIEFILSPIYQRTAAIFTDAPLWFMHKAKDGGYIHVFPYIRRFLELTEPVLESVLRRLYPGWEPGSVSFSELVPDLEGECANTALWDAALSEVRSRSAKAGLTSKDEEIVQDLSKDLFSPSCVHATSKAAAGVFSATFSKKREESLGSGGLGIVKIPVKNIGRAGQEEVPAYLEGNLDRDDWNVLGSVSNIYRYAISTRLQAKPGDAPSDSNTVRISFDAIYRGMVGRKDVCASKTEKDRIFQSLNRLQKARVLFLDTQQLESLAEDGTPISIKDRFSLAQILPGTIGGATVNGNEIRYVELSTMPPILQEALESGMKIEYPANLTDVQEVDKLTGLPNGVHIQATPRRINIRQQLAQRTQGINEGFKKSKNKKKYGLSNHTIILDNFFSEIDIPNDTPGARRANQKDIREQLDYLVSVKHIDGWKFMPHTAADQKRGKRGYGRVQILPKGWIEAKEKEAEGKTKAKP